jgi:uncharacterized protein YdhG (YjbR/CyaY superfamily)
LTPKFGSVDEYLAAQPEGAGGILERARAAIRGALPEAEETISYNIPTYKIHGRAVLYLAGWKRHYSIYPASAALVAEFQQELAAYEVEKGTIRFPLSEPVPVELIARLARFQARS